MQVTLSPGTGRVVDIGPSPWIQMGFFDGEPLASYAPTWTHMPSDQYEGYQSRARVLEVIQAILDNDKDLIHAGIIQQWINLASVRLRAYLWSFFNLT